MYTNRFEKYFLDFVAIAIIGIQIQYYSTTLSGVLVTMLACAFILRRFCVRQRIERRKASAPSSNFSWFREG